jgi:hypothetical protein
MVGDVFSPRSKLAWVADHWDHGSWVGADVEADWMGADEVAPDEADGRGPAISLDL